MMSKRLRTRKFDLLKLLKWLNFEKHFRNLPHQALYVHKSALQRIQARIEKKRLKANKTIKKELDNIQKEINQLIKDINEAEEYNDAETSKESRESEESLTALEAEKLGEIKELRKVHALKSLQIKPKNEYTINVDSSLLISKNNSEYILYELIHDPMTRKKRILQVGHLNSFREVTDPYLAPHFAHFALTAYPLYPKKFMKQYTAEKVIEAELDWKTVVKLNKVAPGCFVNVRQIFYGGDKSTKKNPDNQLLYVVTDIYPQTLGQFLQSKSRPIDEIKFIFTKLFEKYRLLYLQQLTNTDCNFDNIVMTENHGAIDVLFCNPHYLVKHVKTEELDDGLEFPFKHNLKNCLTNFYTMRFLGENLTEDEIAEMITEFWEALECFLKNTDAPPLEPSIGSNVNNLINDFARLEHLARTPDNSVNHSDATDQEPFRSDESSGPTDSMESHTDQEYSHSKQSDQAADEKEEEEQEQEENIVSPEKLEPESKENNHSDTSSNTDSKDSEEKEDNLNPSIIQNLPAFIDDLAECLSKIPSASTLSQRLFCRKSPSYKPTQTFIASIIKQKEQLRNPHQVFQDIANHINEYRNILCNNKSTLYLKTLNEFLKQGHNSSGQLSNTELVNSMVNFSKTLSKSRL